MVTDLLLLVLLAFAFLRIKSNDYRLQTLFLAGVGLLLLLQLT